jgi:hypothetical protein
MIEAELGLALSRPRYGRHTRVPSGDAEGAVGANGHHHGHRSRSLPGSFGQMEIEVPRARLNTPDGKTTEWKSKALRALSEAHTCCRRTDRRRLNCRHQRTPGAPRARLHERAIRGPGPCRTPDRSKAWRALRRLQRESPTLPLVLVSERGAPFSPPRRVHPPGLRPALRALTAGPLAAREAFFARIISVNSI